MQVPQLKRHGTGQAYIWWKGKAKYFGKFGEPATDRAYWRWRESLGPEANGGRTVGELLAMWEEAKKPNRHERSRLNNVRDALGSISGLEVNQYTPSIYEEHRACVAATGTRTAKQVNALMRFMRKIFKWGYTKSIVQPATWQSLGIVEQLGDHDLERQPKERTPANLDHVLLTMEHLSDKTWAMIRLLMLTGARPKEIVSLKKSEIHKNGPNNTWFAFLKDHKNAKRKKKRFLVFYQEAQEILTAQSDGESDWFFPSSLLPGTHYQESSLRQAVGHACKAAGVPHWTPYQIRHTVGTDIAVDQGLIAAAAALGQYNISTTMGYAHMPDLETLKRAV